MAHAAESLQSLEGFAPRPSGPRSRTTPSGRSRSKLTRFTQMLNESVQYVVTVFPSSAPGSGQFPLRIMAAAFLPIMKRAATVLPLVGLLWLAQLSPALSEGGSICHMEPSALVAGKAPAQTAGVLEDALAYWSKAGLY